MALAISILSVSAFSQSTRSKPKPLATPLPVLSSAEIISRAQDQIELARLEQVAVEANEEKPTAESQTVKELRDRIKKLESEKKLSYGEKQKRLLLNLDILTRAEQRTESLRKQLFDMIEKENSVKSRLDQIEFEIRPEMIERTLQMAGSMKPEEIRDNRRKSLNAERQNLESLLTDIQRTRLNTNFNLEKAELMVEKLRTKLESEIDDSFLNNDPS